MCQFFKKRGYPDSRCNHRQTSRQEIDRETGGETSLQTSENKETNRILFTLTYHPGNLALKNVIIKNLKILRNEPETKHIFLTLLRSQDPNRFKCTTANVIYCITCTLQKKICIGETGRRLADRFHEHLRDVEKNDTDGSKPFARHFNLPTYLLRPQHDN